MINQKLLKASLEGLLDLKSEVSGQVDEKVICQIDEIINSLEKLQSEKSHNWNTAQVVFLLGTVLEHLPEIMKAIESLTRGR